MKNPIEELRDAADSLRPTQLDRIEAMLIQLTTKKVSKPRAANQYPNDFVRLWESYPKRAGANPKTKALAAWRARIGEGGLASAWLKTINDMDSGVDRYNAYCEATGKTGTEYVMQAATFFGPDKHYENDWTIPKPKPDKYHIEIYSQSHKPADFSRDIENSLDATDPYAHLKGE